jgi:hypothetical protein
MKPSEVAKLLTSLFTAGLVERPVHLEGAPGVGKTSIPKQVADAMGIGFKIIHVPLLMPEDYSFPLPNAAEKTVHFIVSKELFPIEGTDCPETGVLVLDELAQGSSEAQKILRNLILERKIHGYRLKKGWAIVTTGNRVTDRAGAVRLLSHMANALTQIEVDVSLDDWTNWALDNGVAPEVISFIRFRPELLMKFDANESKNPTPRSWAMGVSGRFGKIDAAHEYETFKGDVGEGPAAEFLGFVKIARDCPSPDSIILDPTGADVPTKKPAALFAIMGALAHKATPDNFERIMKYVKRVPAEFSVLFVRDSIRLNPKIQTCKAFIQWAAKDGAKILS